MVSANFEGGRMVAQYLWDRGHRSFALITGNRPNLNFQLRLDGFRSWIDERLDAEVRVPVYTGDVWSDGGAVAARQILGKGHLPTAVFCVNDHLAIDAMAEFKNANCRVPEDISIVGFDDISISAYASTPLTTVVVDKIQMGREAARIIMESVKTSTPVPNGRNEMPLNIVERASVSFIPVS